MAEEKKKVKKLPQMHFEVRLKDGTSKDITAPDVEAGVAAGSKVTGASKVISCYDGKVVWDGAAK